MQYSLQTRFQGALIGGHIVYINLHQVAPNQLIIDTIPSLNRGIASLTDPARFDPQTWANNIAIDRPSPERSLVAMLPLMLFFHDDRFKLRSILIEVSHTWQLDWETCSSAIAIGYIISRSLTESFDAETIIAELLAEMNNLHPALFEQLSQLAELAHQPISLQQVSQKLAATHPIITPTGLAIYCCLSTPTDFSLATRRAYHLQHRSLLTCALTGLLAGAQHSLAGIPLNGLMATQDRQQWLAVAENLLRAWAGVYAEYRPQATAQQPLSVAAPRVIQRRN